MIRNASATLKVMSLLFLLSTLLLNPVAHGNSAENSTVVIHHSDEITSNAKGLFDIILTLTWDRSVQSFDEERLVTFKVEVKNINPTVRHLRLGVGKVLVWIDHNVRIEKDVSSQLIEFDLDSHIDVFNAPTLFYIKFQVPSVPANSAQEVAVSLSYLIEIMGDFHYVDSPQDYYEGFNLRGITGETSIALTPPVSQFPWEEFVAMAIILALGLMCVTTYFTWLKAGRTKYAT